MPDTYVLVHGAGHTVYCPTLAGNRAGDDRSRIGLEDAIASAVDYIEAEDLMHVRLVGHSYGGMVISGVGDRIAPRLRRLVYLNAFVPLGGESVNDMLPEQHRAMFEAMAAANDNALNLPFDIWREAFINDADLSLAQLTYGKLNPHPYRTFTDRIRLRQPLAELALGKSYINCQQDTALPQSLPWHPRLSERLGLFRLIECPGSHQAMFSNPQRVAQAIVEAGRE